MTACVAALLLAAAPFFERIVPLEVQTGVVRLRTVEAPLLEVPDPRLRQNGPRADVGLDSTQAASWSAHRFTRLFAIDFRLETRRTDRPPEIADRGSLLIAVRVGEEDLLALEERIRAHLASLEPEAFAASLAGFYDSQPPLDRLAGQSVDPSWTCKVESGRAAATVYFRGTWQNPGSPRVVSSFGSVGFTTGEVPDRLCPMLQGAAESAAPEELRTMPHPIRVRELVVEEESGNTLPGEIRLQDLPPLPGGVRRAVREVGLGESGDRVGVWNEGTSMEATYRLAGKEWSATTERSSLSPDLLARGAFVSRWTVTEGVRQLGAAPRRSEETTRSMMLALVPVAPPEGAEAEAGTVLPVRFDAAAFRAEIARRIEPRATLDGAALERVLTEHPAGLDGGSWMLLLCREDGTASFALPPTLAKSPISNAALVCAGVERMLP